MATHLTQHRGGFGPGRTEITTLDEREDPTGIALSVWKLTAGESGVERPAGETAYLLMNGELEVELGGVRYPIARRSLFDEGPSCVHLSATEEVRFVARSDVELTVYATANLRRFPARVIEPSAVADEHRGRGQVRDAALRIVRTAFDGSSSDPAAELVLGEVVTLPGRWSSYPPHHHPQPEIYHYRFTREEGWGHAELGEQVVKVRHRDTIKILNGVDHPQCAAPGYGMYYSWVIRHLPGAPYRAPTFAPEHAWTMKEGASFWWPRGLP